MSLSQQLGENEANFYILGVEQYPSKIYFLPSYNT